MAKKRGPVFRLLIMALIAIVVFMGLALGEDYANGILKRWRAGQAAGTQSDKVSKIANRYPSILEKAYDKTSPKLLKSVTTEKQITKVRLYMAYNHWELKKKFVGVLKNQTIDSVKVKGKKATVKVTETWDSHYLVEENGKVVDKTTESYKVDYGLVKKGSKWLVNTVESKKI